jgi:hypothetical protein
MQYPKTERRAPTARGSRRRVGAGQEAYFLSIGDELRPSLKNFSFFDMEVLHFGGFWGVVIYS